MPNTEPWNRVGTQDKFVLFLTVLLLTKRVYHFVNKGLYSQSYSFSSSHVQMWELDHKEGWTLKDWCFWVAVLEKTLENPLDCKEIKPVNPKGNQPWIFIGRTVAKAEASILWPPNAKSQLTGKDSEVGKDWRQKEKGVTEDEMVSTTDSMDMNLSKLQKRVEDRGAWNATLQGIARRRTQLSNWTTTTRVKGVMQLTFS